ncbi:hypothetical protein [Flavobacterium notoginsengisoli]|uniref:hypothetical protein n=1 Tax=Flavobacterium notoginsengisoli TaxID=1478199 RepID=UPI00362F9B99
MKKIILFIFFNVPYLIHCQEKPIDLKYKQETKLLLNYILKNYLETNTVIEKKASRVNIQDCPSTYESPILYNNEKEYVVKCINNPKILYWQKEYFPNLKIIENEKIDSVFNNANNGWNEFHKSYGHSLTSFSSPIFLRNYQIAIIKFSITSDSLAGYGFEAVFTKKDNDWVISACSWDD